MEGLYRLPQAAAPLEQTDQLDFAGQRKHVFSHRVWKMECYRGQWDDQVQETLPEHCFWIAKDQLDTLPIVGAKAWQTMLKHPRITRNLFRSVRHR